MGSMLALHLKSATLRSSKTALQKFNTSVVTVRQETLVVNKTVGTV